MERDPFVILSQVVRLAHGTKASLPRKISRVLRCLRRSLDLRQVSLLLLAPRGRVFDRSVQAPGPPGPTPCHIALADSPAALALRESRFIQQGEEIFLPLLSGRRQCGVLVFRARSGDLSPLPSPELLAALGPLVAGLAESLRKPPAPSRPKSGKSAKPSTQRRLREISLLYGLSRALHSTLRINDLMHLLLSAATAPGEGDFDRAMLFMVNERSGNLQGMLGVTRETAPLVLPRRAGDETWDWPGIPAGALETQVNATFSRQVRRQRIPLDPAQNAMSEAALNDRVVLVTDPLGQPPAAAALAGKLGMSPYACAPLRGGNRPIGVLVVDNPDSGSPMTRERLRFLELFSNQAGQALENALLLQRLETAHKELREAQERLIQREKLATIGEMSASLAHELRNPLVSVGGFAQRLVRIVPAGTKEQEYAAIIAREVERVEKMLTSILAFSKKNLLCFVDCRLPEIIEEALALEEPSLTRAGISLVKEVAADLPQIKGDAQQLRQVLINLIANAREAMAGGGQLELRATRSTLRGEKAVALEVRDSGGGIPPEVMRNLFNPFFTTREAGTGLGLPISLRIVEQHRGEIEVLNYARGAAFVVRLPVRGPEHLSVDNPWRIV